MILFLSVKPWLALEQDFKNDNGNVFLPDIPGEPESISDQRMGICERGICERSIRIIEGMDSRMALCKRNVS